MADTLARTISAIADYLAGRLIPEITGDCAFKADLRCDAIDMVAICLEVEDEFGVLLPPDEPEHCETVGDLARIVARLHCKENA